MTSHHEQLTEALQAYEQIAPEPDKVLAATRVAIRRHRQHRIVLAAAGGVAAAVVLAGTAAVAVPALVDQRHTQPAAPGSTQWRNTLTFNWLPAELGMGKLPYRTASPSFWLSKPAGNGETLTLQVSVDTVAWTPNLNLSGWQRITVHGQPGRIISRPTRTAALVQLPSGHWLHLEYAQSMAGGGGSNRQPALEAGAHRMLDGMSETMDGPPVQLNFRAGYLPAGFQVTRLLTQPDSPEGYGMIVAGTGSQKLLKVTTIGSLYGINDMISDQQPIVDTGSQIGIQMVPSSSTKGERQLPDIQGHRAYAGNDGQMVEVHGFHGGVLEVLVLGSEQAPRPKPASLDELIRVAQGVAWTG